MTKVLISPSKLDALVDAYNSATGSTGQMTLDQLATGIGSMSGGSDLEALALGNLKVFKSDKITSLNGLDYFFANKNGLEEIYLPNLAIGSNASAKYFSTCRALKIADLGKYQTIMRYDFQYTYKIRTLILRREGYICGLSYASEFSGLTTDDPLVVYVPSDMVSRYQTATNWATYYTAGTVVFVPIEGSIYEI